jgi:hypothetical protein
MINVLLIFFVFINLHEAWMNLVAFFLRNPIKANILTPAKKRIVKLVNPKDNKFKIGEHTYIIDEKDVLYDRRVANYFYIEGRSEPLQFISNDENSMDAKYLTDLLIAAELHGSNNFVRDLIKFKYILIGVFVIAAGVIYIVWKTNELEKAMLMIKGAVDSLKNTVLVG